MRPSSITQPGAVLRYRLGPASPDQAPDSPPPPDCCVVDEGDLPDRGATENGAYTVKLSTGGAPTIVQSKYIPSILSSSIPLDTPATPGNTLVMLVARRDSGEPSDPFFGGFDTIAKAQNSQSGNFRSAGMWHRVVTDDESAVTASGDGFTYAAGANGDRGMLVEVTGAYASIFAERNDVASTTALNCGGAVAAPDASMVIGVGSISTGNEVLTTPDAGVTELIDEFTNGNDPHVWMGYRNVASAASSTVGGTLAASRSFCGVTAVFGGTEIAWVTPAPKVSDESDATYDEVDNDELYRSDLGAAYRIVRTRIRIATTTSGARTLTLRGANLADYSDAVVVTTVSFTATGSLTPQDVTGTWYTEGSYRYWQLDASVDEVYRTYSWELYEPTLATNHQHDASGIAYDNSDSGLTADTVQEAIDELAAVGASGSDLDDLSDVVITSPAEDEQLQYVSGQWVNSSRRWEPVTENPGGGPELVWDGDDLVMEWKEY